MVERPASKQGRRRWVTDPGITMIIPVIGLSIYVRHRAAAQLERESDISRLDAFLNGPKFICPF